MQIIPAILTDNEEKFESMMEEAETYADYVQIDIMDGKFVPSKSIPITALADIQTQTKCELHLMVEKPEKLLNNIKLHFVKQVLFHIEATDVPTHIFKELEQFNIRKGLVINPDTDIAELKPYLNEVNTIMFMTVYPGYYGRPLEKKVLEKVTEFKKNHPWIIVGMDGGIKEDNLELVKATGADFACIGSAICESKDPAAAYSNFQEKAGGFVE